MAISCHLSEAQQLNAHHSSDQLKACSEWKQFSFSNVVTSSGNPIAAVNTNVLHFKLSSRSLKSFNRNLRGRCFVIVMLEKNMFS